MKDIKINEPVDYVVIGHLALDQTSDGLRLGGTAAYAALTAQALGLRVGVVTSWREEIGLDRMREIPIVNVPAPESTQFENTYQGSKRRQRVRSVASKLESEHIPVVWQSAKIIHLGPVAQEVNPAMIDIFNAALIGVTPQGWLREWDESGQVSVCNWSESDLVVRKAGAVVLSPEDVGYDEEQIEEIVSNCAVVAVTEAEDGARLYWNGDVRRFRAPIVEEVDPTGAGDIFASAFFYRLFTTRDPWEAARFATNLSAYSVSRPGLFGIPTAEEIHLSMVEVL